jgi:hypothetical protein
VKASRRGLVPNPQVLCVLALRVTLSPGLSLSFSFCLSVFLSLFLCLSVFLSLSLYLCLSVSFCVSLSVFLCVCLSSLCVSPLVSLPLCVCLTVCLSVSLFHTHTPSLISYKKSIPSISHLPHMTKPLHVPKHN